MTQIDYTSEDTAQKIQAMGSAVLDDAIRCVESADLAGLIYIANMALGRPGNSRMSAGEAYDLADYLSSRLA